MMVPQPEPLFYEEQRLRLTRLRVLTAIPPISMMLLAIWQVWFGHPWGKNPMSNSGIIGWTVFLWLIYWRLNTIKQVTELRPGELRVAMRGLWMSMRISLDQIKSASVVTFDPMRDWGGYGVRNTRRGKAYITAGAQGVELKMVSGKTVLIGSQRASELASALAGKVTRS